MQEKIGNVDQKIRVVYNQKGGVGKTTLAVNFAAAAALSGKRTLLVDSDPQGNSTHYLLGSPHERGSFQKSLVSFYESCLGLSLFRQSVFDHMEELEHSSGSVSFRELKKKIPLLHLMPCTRELEDLRSKLEAKHKIHKLRDGLRGGGFERIYLDPPPAADFFAYSCLVAANEVIVPVDCDSFSLMAAKELNQMVNEIKNDHNPDLTILGIVVNQFQKSTKHSAALVKELKSIGIPVFEPFLSSSVRVRESHSSCVPFVLQPGSFTNLFQELVQSVEKKSNLEVNPEASLSAVDKNLSENSVENSVEKSDEKRENRKSVSAVNKQNLEVPMQ
jgi:chromosome partitioning protein